MVALTTRRIRDFHYSAPCPRMGLEFRPDSVLCSRSVVSSKCFRSHLCETTVIRTFTRGQSFRNTSCFRMEHFSLSLSLSLSRQDFEKVCHRKKLYVLCAHFNNYITGYSCLINLNMLEKIVSVLVFETKMGSHHTSLSDAGIKFSNT